MEKERKIKTISVIALIVAVLGLTVAFAALSTTLTIKGNAKVESGKWSIYFDNLSEPTKKGKAIVDGDAKINDSDKTKIQDINVTLIQPKDEVTYTANLVNDGTIDAEISSITKPVLDNLSDYVEFSAKYNDDNDKEIEVGDILKSEETKNVTISIKFKEEATTLPENDLTVNLSYEINFVQSDSDEDDMQGDESQRREEDLLRKYILGQDEKGRDLSEIMDIENDTFKQDSKMEEDISSKVEYLADGLDAVYDEEKPIIFIYIKYNNKVYKVTVSVSEEPEKYTSQSMVKVYEPKGREGEKLKVKANLMDKKVRKTGQ